MKTALTLFILSGLLGLALAVAGVYLLAGSGWALIAGAVSSLLISGFIRRGLISA
ncbi:hypothetical protein [Orrella sp. 11846]|uniref:hypothetical protein n=1 Tax=Orrella sp. 11846 TaxID=3409913 RepID=UPI003B5A2228